MKSKNYIKIITEGRYKGSRWVFKKNSSFFLGPQTKIKISRPKKLLNSKLSS